MHSCKLLNLVIKDCYYKVYYKDKYLGDILAAEDGFYGWWPLDQRGGYWTSNILAEIANILDELNEPWEKKIDEYFNDKIPNISH